MPIRLLPLLCIALSLLLTAETHAQLRDIRLAPELRDYSLPAEAQIQSVASIGSRHLVAWGTTAFDADSTVINVLWMRLLDGSTPLLENRIVHSPQARPYGFVLVVASAQQFLVFWNDRRADAPGTYLQRVDFNGSRVGGEERIDIGPVKNDPVKKPKSEVSALTFTSLPGWTFVQVDSARPFVVRDNAVVDTRPLAIDHMQGAYYLAEDTSVVVLKGKAVRFYRNLYDTVAVRTVAVPQLDSALANSEVVMRDSSGKYEIIYAVTTNPKTFASAYYKSTFISDSITSPSLLFTDYNPESGANDYACYGFLRQRGCDNVYRLMVSYKGWDQRSYQGIPEFYAVYQAYTTDVNSQGVILRSYMPGYTQYPLCSSIEPIVRRKADSQSTQILVDIETDTVAINTTTAFVRPWIPRTIPNLFLDSNNLVVSWYFDNNQHKPQPGIWHSSSSTQPIEKIDSLSFELLTQWNPQGAYPGILQLTEKVINLNGATFAYLMQLRVDTLKHINYVLDFIYVTSLTVCTLTHQGWVTSFKDGGYGSSDLVPGGGKRYGPPTLNIEAYSQDHFLKRLYAQIRSVHYEEGSPKESRLIYSIGAQQDAASLPALLWLPNHQRLSLDRWVRWHLADDSTRWTFDVVDTANTIYATRTLHFDGDPRSIFITQNYPDRSMAIIWSGSGGVRGTFLSHALDVLQENVQISETRDSISYPSAAYRNDTLFVAWEDYRNGGIADVYGTAFTGAPKASGVEIAPNPQRGAQTVQIWPNPARESVTIALPALSQPAVLDVINQLGQVQLHMTIPADALAQQLDISTLDPGVYIARLSSPLAPISTRFVIIH